MPLQNVLVLCACMAASTYTSSLAIAQSDESARGVIFDEQHVIESEQGVLASCAALSPEQQYVRLKNWVLPGDKHESFRISAIYLPLNAPSSGLSTIESGPFKDRFASATLALVETAKSLGQLEDLLNQIDSANARTDRDQCAKSDQGD